MRWAFGGQRHSVGRSRLGSRLHMSTPDGPVRDGPSARICAYRSGLGWLSPLIKTVVAGTGQRVIIGWDVEIDGESLVRSAVRLRDAEGRAVEPYEGGGVPPDHLFLHSEFTGSYDSRYFGPVPAAGLLGLTRPIFTFDP